jgi:head-tail adaptor
MGIAAGTLDRKVRIERPVADTSFDGAGSGTWAEVATVWANVRDMLPSRSERLDDGMNFSARPARVRMRRRADLTPDMRLLVMRKDDVTQVERVLQIVAGPADFDTDASELMAQEYRPAGNEA